MRNTIKLIASVAAVVALAQVPVFAGGFTDDFNRPDGAIGNGWTLNNGGNGGGNNSAPVAGIVNGAIQLNRAGWGSNAFYEAVHTFDVASVVQSDLYASKADDATSINLQAKGANGGYAYIRVRRLSDSTTQMQVSTSLDGKWYGWSDYASLGAIDWATYSVTTNGTGVVNVSVKANGSELWNKDYTGFEKSNFVSAGLVASWENWTTDGLVYADNFSATAVPEPSGLLVLASALPLIMIRRKH